MSSSENRLESVVELVASLTGAPVCLLSRIENGQAELLAKTGISLDVMDIDGSFCELAIESPGSVLQITDSREDPRFPRRGGSELCLDDQPLISYIGVPVLDDAGLPIGTVCAMDTVPHAYTQDVTDSLERLADYAATLIEMQTRSGDPTSEIDLMTGLDTRALVVKDAHVSGGSKDLVAIVDLNGMTEINAELGRDYGDLLLREVAAALLEAAPDTAQVARIGGDAFAIVGPASIAWEALTTEMLSAVKGPFDAPDGGKIQLSAVIGVGLRESADESMEDLVVQAETAVKHAKQRGPGSVVLADEHALADHSRPARIRNSLHGSISRGEFSVAYQAITDLKTGSVVGTEALCRWQHPELGAVSPVEFIPKMEEAGLIADLTDFMLATALRDFSDGLLPGEEVSVNLSPFEIDDELPDRIRAAFVASGAVPANLIIEVTEKINELNREAMLGPLREVWDMGVRIAIDDFGAGSTSVAQLRSLPVNRLKLDRALVRDLDGEDSSRAAIVIRSMVSIADGLDLDLVAEGVENEAQADLLRDAQIPLVQGYLFGRPEVVGELGLPIKVAAEAEDLAGSFFERTSDMAFVSKANRIIHWNSNFQRQLGWSDEEIRSGTMADVFHPGDRATVRATLEDPDTDSNQNVEARILTREGEYINTFLSVSTDARLGLKIVAAVDIGRLKELEAHTQRLTSTLTAIAELQDEYIGRGLSRAWWEKALARVVEISECEFGFIGRFADDENGDPILHCYALSDVSWNEWSKSVFDDYSDGGLQFGKLDTLYGPTLARGETVLTNDAPHDQRASGTPEGHPALRNYAGIPLVHKGETVGMVGIANRPQGMDDELVDLLEPLTSHLAQLVHLDLKYRASAVPDDRSAESGAERSVLLRLLEIERLTAEAMPEVLASHSVAEASAVIQRAVTELLPSATLVFQDTEGSPLPHIGADALTGVSRISCDALANGTPKVSKPGLMLDTCKHADPRCYATFCVPINGEDGQTGLVSVSVPSAVDLSPEQPANVADSVLQMLITLTSGLAVKYQAELPAQPA